MKTKDYKTIGFHVSDGIARLILNQPPSNKMTMEFFRELDHLLPRLQRSAGIRAMVIYGNGRHFSSGTDLPILLDQIEMKMPVDGIPGFLLKNYLTLGILDRLPFPVVAAVRGVCLGSAMELVLACHFRFCSKDALFGLPESTFNLIPGLGGILKVASLAGKARAIQLVIKGETFTASEALRLNLVDRILPKNELIEQSLVFAGSVAEKYRKGKRKLYLGKNFEL
ncbi:MAG: enoyl-CoA hydratase/isomerase family protein [bacterium]